MADNKAEVAPVVMPAGPIIPTWVDEDHFVGLFEEKVTGFKKILKFEPSLSGGAGENYSSCIVKVKATVELEDGSTEDLGYMIKTNPQSEQSAMMVQMLGYFPKEMTVYGGLLPEFEETYRNVGKDITFGPKFFTLKKDPGVPYILLEDLCAKGFKNLNRREGLEKDQVEAALRTLAKLHAASVLRYETKGEYEGIFTQSIFNEQNKFMIEAMFKSSQDFFINFLETQEFAAPYVGKIKQMQDKAVDYYIKFSEIIPEDFNVLCHGDMWINNIMFRQDDEGKFSDLRLIDFQQTRYGSPAGDLYYFLLTSPKLELKVSHFDDFIKYYHDNLVENLQLLNYSKKIPSLKELRMQMLRSSFWGFITATTTMAGSLLDPTEIASAENLMAEGDQGDRFRSMLYTNPRYLKHLAVVLPWLDTMGLLD